MRAALIALTIVLLTSSAWAGPAARRMMAVVGSGVTYETFTINAIGSITSSSGPITTGTESISTGTGFILVNASCDAGDEHASVTLTVDSTTALLSCINGEQKAQILSLPVTAGTHSVSVAGEKLADAQFTASYFRKPRPTQQIVTDNGEAVYDNGEQVTDTGGV